MFQKRIGQIAAILMLFSVSSQPILAHASEPASPAATSEAAPQTHAKTKNLEPITLDSLRHKADVTITDTQQWVKAKSRATGFENPVKVLDRKVDRLQDHAKPLGRSIRSSVNVKVPGEKLVQFGERTFSVYGIILILAFGLLTLFLTLSAPLSRLGGRH